MKLESVDYIKRFPCNFNSYRIHFGRLTLVCGFLKKVVKKSCNILTHPVRTALCSTVLLANQVDNSHEE